MWLTWLAKIRCAMETFICHQCLCFRYSGAGYHLDLDEDSCGSIPPTGGVNIPSLIDGDAANNQHHVHPSDGRIHYHVINDLFPVLCMKRACTSGTTSCQNGGVCFLADDGSGILNLDAAVKHFLLDIFIFRLDQLFWELIIHMGRHVCFIFFFLFFLLCWNGELSIERIEVKFSLKIALVPWCLANKLPSAIRAVFAVQYSKIDVGFHGFLYNFIILSFLNHKKTCLRVFSWTQKQHVNRWSGARECVVVAWSMFCFLRLFLPQCWRNNKKNFQNYAAVQVERVSPIVHCHALPTHARTVVSAA